MGFFLIQVVATILVFWIKLIKLPSRRKGLSVCERSSFGECCALHIAVVPAQIVESKVHLNGNRAQFQIQCLNNPVSLAAARQGACFWLRRVPGVQ